jgi:uncharacterized membrane protein
LCVRTSMVDGPQSQSRTRVLFWTISIILAFLSFLIVVEMILRTHTKEALSNVSFGCWRTGHGGAAREL